MHKLTKRNLTVSGGIFFALGGFMFGLAGLINENYLLVPFTIVSMALGIVLLSVGFGGLDEDLKI